MKTSKGELPLPPVCASPGELGFARLVGTLGAVADTPPVKPVDRVRSRAARTPADPHADESATQALERAERLVRSGQIEDALRICAAIRPRLEQGGALARGICEHVEALGHQYAGRLRESMHAGYRALSWFSLTDASDRIIRMLACQAIVLARLGEASEALTLLERATGLLPGSGLPVLEHCIYWNNASAVWHSIGQKMQAIVTAKRAAALLDQVDQPDLHAVCTTNLLMFQVDALREQGGSEVTDELLKAARALQRQVEHMAATGRHHLVPKAAEAAADVFMSARHHETARGLLQLGIASTQITNAGPARGVLELRLAKTERLAGHYRVANGHIAHALDLLEQGQDMEELASAYLENSLLHEAQQHWRAALDSHKRYARLREDALKAQLACRFSRGQPAPA